MKKTGLVLLTLLLTATICIACAPSQPSASAQPEASSEDDSSMPIVSVTPSESSLQVDEASVPEKLYVADAAMYRGTVTKIEENTSGKLITLEQAKGTDFGAVSLQFRITADTQCSVDEIKLVEGVYLEVFYGVAPGQALDAQTVQDAIAINFYPEAAMVNFNGILGIISPSSDKVGEGSLVMEDMENQQEVVFHYSADTQFYLDFEELKQGDKLNIFHRGVYTMSLPPQGLSLEVRNYAEPASSK